MAVPQQAKDEIAQFLADGDKLGAIRHLSDNYKFSLNESRRLVEALQAQHGQEATSPGADPHSDDLATAHINHLMSKGEKVDAVKYAKDRFNISLKDARSMVEGAGRQLHRRRRAGHNDSFVYWVFTIFCIVGVVFTAVGVGVYINQSRSIENSELITGRVVEINSRGKGLTAPVIEYEWNGQLWLYASSSYSTFELYALNDEVPIYVNREDPEDVTPDTFLDRWMVIVILGILGVCFTIGPLLVYFIAFR